MGSGLNVSRITKTLVDTFRPTLSRKRAHIAVIIHHTNSLLFDSRCANIMDHFRIRFVKVCAPGQFVGRKPLVQGTRSSFESPSQFQPTEFVEFLSKPIEI